MKLLKSLRPTYRKYQVEGNVSFFWTELDDVWFAVYPDRTYDGGKDWMTVSSYIVEVEMMYLHIAAASSGLVPQQRSEDRRRQRAPTCCGGDGRSRRDSRPRQGRAKAHSSPDVHEEVLSGEVGPDG